MEEIKFGTDGWRAIIGDDFTVDNVRRVAYATALYMEKQGMQQAVIGRDCRFGGELFLQTAVGVLTARGIHVIVGTGITATPMLSLAVAKTESGLGIVITASHNPPSYNGYKLKSQFGGPSLPSEIAEVEALIPDHKVNQYLDYSSAMATGLVTEMDLEEMYYQHVLAHFDVEGIQNSGIKIAYDAMYGAGQNIVKRLLPQAVCLHAEINPSFGGTAPEPIGKNLRELENLISSDKRITFGFANDGDADRIGIYDEDGKFVDSHHILLLLLMYTYEHKKQEGQVVVTFSVTNKMQKLAEQYGLPFHVTKIGFKYIAEIMTHTDVIVGGEESGGLAVKGHIPERDGVWIAMMILEFMSKSGKSLKQLIQDLYAKVGSFACDRDDKHITEALKQQVIKHCKEGQYTRFGDYEVHKMESIDGYKFWIDEDRWVMIRPSGTEPVLRIYAQAPKAEEVRKILDAVGAVIAPTE
jgi:phosphomannomutase